MIQVNINDVMDEIDEFTIQNPGNYGENNSNSSTKYPKFINLPINNRSSHFVQFRITIKIIQVDVNITEANNIVSILFR